MVWRTGFRVQERNIIGSNVLQGYRRRPVPALRVVRSTGPRQQPEVAGRRRSAAEPVAVEGRLGPLGQAGLRPGIQEGRLVVVESSNERVASREGGTVAGPAESLSDSHPQPTARRARRRPGPAARGGLRAARHEGEGGGDEGHQREDAPGQRDLQGAGGDRRRAAGADRPARGPVRRRRG
ncbi:hypothetical protein THAOC_28032, partial [Thalassiosira oceanica]